MTAAVVFEHVTKRYRRGRERINLRAVLPGRWGEPKRGDFHSALSDFSFELEPGHSLGLIGPNGAGKSTTLKLVAGVIAPTGGRVTVRGRTASLIELGAGFHPDMTGRENLYFSAAVLGMGPQAVKARFDDIVSFADIGPYLDTPVKRYSSGMLARLGFAVATHLDADILVLDEVLAVGDAAFQRKCHERLFDIGRQGVALLYVTHALWTLPMLCEEAILLANGSVQSRGRPVDVVVEYERLHQSGSVPGTTESASGSGGGIFRRVTTSGTMIEPGAPLEVRMELDLAEPFPDGNILVMLADAQLKVYAAVSSRKAGLVLDRTGPRAITCLLEELPLQPGPYELYVAFFGDYRLPAVDEMRNLKLEVLGDPVDPNYGVLRVPSRWTAG